MTDSKAKQDAYAARRAAHTGTATRPLVEVRIVFAQKLDRIERHYDLEAAARAHPDAIRIERVDACGGWW